MAIDDLLDEHEQSEKVRDWLRRNAIGLIGGVALGLALIGGWRWWQAQQVNDRMQSSAQYQSFLQSLKTKDLQKGQAQAAALRSDIYKTLAAFDLAKAQVEAGKPDLAIATLRQSTPTDSGLAQLRAQRLARLMIDAGKHDEAIKLLKNAQDAASIEARGDAQLALGQRAAARTAYEQALVKIDAASPQRRLLELKLTEAGGTPAKTKAII